MIKISKSLFQSLQQNTYFVRGEKCILICTKKNSPSILEQLSYDNIVPIVEDGLKVKQDENLYLFKYDSLNQQQIQYMKQVFITYNIKSRNYNPKIFVYLWKMRNSLPQDEKEINQISQNAFDYGDYRVNNQRERVVKQNEYYTISDNVFVHDFHEINSSEFHQCYILRFKFYTQGLALQHKDLGYHIYYIGKAYNKSVGFYGFDKNKFSLQQVQQIAQRRTKFYKEKENKKKSSVVRQLVKIANEVSSGYEIKQLSWVDDDPKINYRNEIIDVIHQACKDQHIQVHTSCRSADEIYFDFVLDGHKTLGYVDLKENGIQIRDGVRKYRNKFQTEEDLYQQLIGFIYRKEGFN